MNWPLAKLSDVCEINIGRTPARANSAYWGKGQPWLSIADMNQGRSIVETKEQITQRAIDETGIKKVNKGTVLFSFKLSIGKIGITQRDMFTNEAIAALPIKNKHQLCEEYLLYALSKMDAKSTTDRAVMGATLNKQKLAELKIPLPPLKDQKRIAAILDKADALYRKQEKSIALIDNLLQSVFLDMFGNPVTNPKGMEITSLENLCHVISDCLHTTPKHFDTPNQFPSIRSSELQKGFIDLSSAKYVTEEEYNIRIQRHKPVPGDVIYCREGARYGNVGFVPEGMTPCLGQRTMLFQAREGVATPEYLWRLMCSDALFEQSVKKAGGAASPHVNIKDIRQFKCLLPPYVLQQKFSAMCRKILEMKCFYLASHDTANLLFNSLMHVSFNDGLMHPNKAA